MNFQNFEATAASEPNAWEDFVNYAKDLKEVGVDVGAHYDDWTQTWETFFAGWKACRVRALEVIREHQNQLMALRESLAKAHSDESWRTNPDRMGR